MIAAFLLPFPLRGYRAPYLWIYYRLLAAFDEPLLFIAGADYLRPPAEWAAGNRWEMQEISGRRLGYPIPTAERMAAQHYRLLPDSLFAELLALAGGNPVAAFRRLLTERLPALEAAFADALAGRDDLEAVLTWCNCPSLSAAAAARGIPVLHLEMGPLRWPDYRPTAYLDFTGVNGNTEAAARHHQAGWRRLDTSVARLRAFFAVDGVAGAAGAAAPEFDAGVVLQVEDDSNLVAFGHGFDNQALIIHTHLHHADGRVLVRGHPGSLFAVKPNWYQVDDSPGSVPFIRRCRRIATINSSVGLEAMLLETPTTVLGDCSYRFIGEAADAGDLAGRLAFYLFAYLVPMDLIYAPDYLRFRLSRPAEAAIVARHLAAYGQAAAAGPAEAMIEAALAAP